MESSKDGLCKTCEIKNDFWIDAPDGDLNNLGQKYVDKKLSQTQSRAKFSDETLELDLLDDIKLPACPLSIKTFDGYKECCSKCLYSHCDARAWHAEHNIDPFQGKTKCEIKTLEAEFNNIDINYANWLQYVYESRSKILDSFTLPPKCWNDGSFKEIQDNQREPTRDYNGVDGEPYCVDTETGEKVSDVYYDRLDYPRCMNDGKYEENAEWLESNGASSLAWSLTVGMMIGINWMA